MRHAEFNDPALVMLSLAAARAKPGADCMAWIEGTSSLLPEAAFDVAVMTSHVAQFFVTDENGGCITAAGTASRSGPTMPSSS